VERFPCKLNFNGKYKLHMIGFAKKQKEVHKEKGENRQRRGECGEEQAE